MPGTPVRKALVRERGASGGRDDKDLYSGLIRLHILHHAAHEPIFGLAIMEELAWHGYRISAGTLYPLLHGMERRGYLGSRVETLGGRRRRVYRATALGKRTLAGARAKVRELFGELFEEEPTLIAKPKETRHGGRSR